MQPEIVHAMGASNDAHNANMMHKAANINAGTNKLAANGLGDGPMQQNIYATNEIHASMNYDAANNLPRALNLTAMKAARRPEPFDGRPRSLRASTWLQSPGGCHEHPHPRNTCVDYKICM